MTAGLDLGLVEHALALAVNVVDLERGRGLDLGQLVLHEGVHGRDGAVDGGLQAVKISVGPLGGHGLGDRLGQSLGLGDSLGLLDLDLGHDRLGGGGLGQLAQLICEVRQKLIDLLGVVSRGGEGKRRISDAREINHRTVASCDKPGAERERGWFPYRRYLAHL